MKMIGESCRVSVNRGGRMYGIVKYGWSMMMKCGVKMTESGRM